jgi:predicted ABC-type ATPase
MKIEFNKISVCSQVNLFSVKKQFEGKYILKMKCYILAGPNGAGKTTFANEFLPIEAKCLNFINADMIAQDLSSFRPEKMAIEAGRLMIERIVECVRKNESFAFETTLSGKGYIKKIVDWKNIGYEIIIYFLKLPSVEFAIERVKLRVSRGGHNIPEQDIRRRFQRSLVNFNMFYKQLADSWIVFDTSAKIPSIIAESR